MDKKWISSGQEVGKERIRSGQGPDKNQKRIRQVEDWERTNSVQGAD